MNDFDTETGNQEAGLRIRITSIRIRILLLKVVRIFGHWSKSLHGSILSLHASIVCIRVPPWLHFEPLQLQNFDFNANPDLIQLFTLNANPELAPQKMRTHAAPDLQPS
jgi:hypothetical protein